MNSRFFIEWTDERIAELTRLWNDGLSASQIASRMDITRNSILGKVHRLGLPRRDGKATRMPAHGGTKVNRPKAPIRVATPVKVIPLRPMAVLKAPEGPGVSIVEMTGCKYAIGFDENAPGRHLFCNHAREGNTPWCAYHHALSFYKPEKGKERKRFRIPVSVLRATG